MAPDEINIDKEIEGFLFQAGGEDRLEEKPRIYFVRRAKGEEKKGKISLGVLASSFNPLTRAHLALIGRARKEYRLGEVLLLLDKENVDKDFFEVSLKDRLLMLMLFFKETPYISLGLSSHGLFLDKLKALEEVYPSETDIFFIVGYDTLIRVLDEKYYDDRDSALRTLFNKSTFLVASREDKKIDAIYDLLNREENREFKGKIGALKLPDSFSDISSSKVRDFIKRGRPIDDLVLPKIEQFIKKKELYLTYR